jgi:tRNA modification GTPase
MSSSETISAVATAQGEASVALIRVSGPESIEIVDRIFRARSGKKLADLQTFTVHYGHLVEPKSPDTERNNVLDEVLVTLFRTPRSYTGEDMIEISCHGGLFVQRQVLKLLARQGARPAEPGEFTRRAFLNGRMDLTQAEAVLDVIRSRSDRALRMANSQLNGNLSREVGAIRDELLDLLAHVEAAIDFPDDEIELLNRKEQAQKVRTIGMRIGRLIQGAAMGRVLREGIHTVIIGRPNVGKSSLLNRFVGVDRAIVTEIPGTTRDVIEESVEIKGLSVCLSDTAGMVQESTDRVERAGVDRAKDLIGESDLVLFVLDGSMPLETADRDVAKLINGRKAIQVVNKCDLSRRLQDHELKGLSGSDARVNVSARFGTGMDKLEEAIVRPFLGEEQEAPEGAWVTHLRHRKALEEARLRLTQAVSAFEEGVPPEMIAVDIKGALQAVGEIIGEVTTDDLLDRIFSQFCIGK